MVEVGAAVVDVVGAADDDDTAGSVEEGVAVVVDGKTIFSKRSLDRFPNEGEIVDLIRAAA